MSSLFDIPAQLAMLLSLTASTAAYELATSGLKARPAPPATVAAEPLTGPMRFSERAWLEALHENPGQSDGYAASVFVTTSGRFYVPTSVDRTKILEARNDAALATRVARTAAERNAFVLRAALKRVPAAADLYVAHVLGPASAITFVKAVEAAPDMPLLDGFPALAASLVEPKDAGAMTVGQFHRQLRSVVRELPRLVAIGLKPSLDEAPTPGASWQAKVGFAEAERVAQ